MNGFLEVLRHPKEKLQELRQRTESHGAQGARLLEAGNFAEAEASFRLALAGTRGSPSRRVGLWLQLGAAQRKQAKLAEAEQSSLQALETAMAGQDVGLQALCLH
ncbi:MAG TPA: hypothetical protein VK419_08980, partial [Bryobacteraceae bacterium]|nr:hypothetical protein [Bryobacteraceae bacterium]